MCKIQITPQLLVAAAGACQKYKLYLDEQHRTMEKAPINIKRSVWKKILIKINCMRLNEDIVSMDKSADDFAQKAEDKGKMTVISQS